MGCLVNVLCLCLILATVQTMKVDLTKSWKTEFGWEVTCSWELLSNDSLQSVRLYNNDRQFLIYRPEADGDVRISAFRRPEDMLIVNCTKSKIQQEMGTCKLTIELFQPQSTNSTIACEVSGERPYFRMDKKSIVIDPFVPPTDAVIEVGAVNETLEVGPVIQLNCTSSGLPSPKLVWTIGDQKIPHAFAGRGWNAMSKLWDSWSALSYTPSSERIVAVCTPESGNGIQLVKGHAAEYNSARAVTSRFNKYDIHSTNTPASAEMIKTD